MRRSPPLLILFTFLAALLLGLVAAASWAADQREVQLPLASGKLVEGVIESADETEIVVRVGPETVRRVPWAQLTALGYYRAKAALTPPADGEARLQLAELAVELGLYVEARVEFEKALALGAISQKDFTAYLMKAEQDAVVAGVAQARKAAEEGDFEHALQVARDLKLHFGGAPNAGAVDRLIGDLLKGLKKLEKEASKASKELARAKVDAERNKEILKRRVRAIGEMENGDRESKNAGEARAKGNVTRARKHAEKADEYYMSARRHLGRLRRILKRDEPAYLEVLKTLNQLDRAHFDVLFQTAFFHWQQTVFTRADEFAARASYIDPVNPELLELRELLRISRIRYRLSDVTNARPIIR